MYVNTTEQEFLNIVEENKAKLQHLCRVYAERREEEKDMYQEIIIEAWRSFSSFRGDAKVSTWLYRLAVNTAISAVRKRKTRRKYHKAYKVESRSRDAEELFHLVPKKERVEKLYEAIGKLGASEKAIITMYLEEFSYEEIAYVTDITENYVGVKLNRIKKKLSRIMEA